MPFLDLKISSFSSSILWSKHFLFRRFGVCNTLDPFEFFQYFLCLLLSLCPSFFCLWCIAWSFYLLFKRSLSLFSVIVRSSMKALISSSLWFFLLSSPCRRSSFSLLLRDVLLLLAAPHVCGRRDLLLLLLLSSFLLLLPLPPVNHILLLQL